MKKSINAVLEVSNGKLKVYNVLVSNYSMIQTKQYALVSPQYVTSIKGVEKNWGMEQKKKARISSNFDNGGVRYMRRG